MLIRGFSKYFKNLQFSRRRYWLDIDIFKMPYYAVASGRTVGIFLTWNDCETQVKGFSGARYKKFPTIVEAQEFITAGGTEKVGTAKHVVQKNSAINASKSGRKQHITNNNKLKRSYSTSSSKNPENGSIKEKSYKRNSRAEDSSESDDDLDTLLNKQMDDIEIRLKKNEKGIDKIINKVTKDSSRHTILIEPPDTKKSRKTSQNEFEKDSQGFVQVYTDGACSSNGRNGARAGIGVYWGDDHPYNVSEPVSGRATNNCGEIQAATRAIKQALQNRIMKLTINTDSQFLINSVTKWMPGWKRKGWKLKSGEPVKNEIDFKDLDSVQNKLEIKWNYVEAHRGVYGNEMADQLAKAGASMYNK